MHGCFPGGARGKESACRYRRRMRPRFSRRVGEVPWSRRWCSTGVFLEMVKKCVKLFGAAFLKCWMWTSFRCIFIVHLHLFLWSLFTLSVPILKLTWLFSIFKSFCILVTISCHICCWHCFHFVTWPRILFMQHKNFTILCCQAYQYINFGV